MQPQTLLDVRLYGGESAHPSSFRGKGWRGATIRLLNWFRYKIETLVQYIALSGSFENELGQVDKVLKVQAQREFRVAVKRERLYSELNDPALTTGVPSSPADTGVSLKEHRYTTRRGEKFVQEGEELLRPVSLEGLVQRYGSAGRDRRYTMGVSVMEDQLSGLDTEEAKGKD